jgi:serine/threonine-protein kinase
METPEKIGKYEVISQIGTGGFGVIYKAWDPFIKRQVAIKMCVTPDEEVRARFQQEAQFVGNLVHRNITLIFDFGVERGVPYIVQEYLSGFDLDQLARAGALREPKTVVAILLQVCEALDFAHCRGIVHRDIKPSNIRVLEDGTVKILDFGIAKSKDAGQKLTQTGIALGTAGYLSPEQIQGGMIDARTDIFALGVVAYELVTRVRPFQGASLSNVLYKILNENPPSPNLLNPACSPQLDRLITRCMAKDPDERFQSAAELFTALRAIAVADAAEVDNSRETTTGILRDAVLAIDEPTEAPPEEPDLATTNLSAKDLPSRPAHTEIEHSPDLGEPEHHRRRPALVTFLVLLGVLVGGGGSLYLSNDLQWMVFGPDGAPWVPTSTPTPTATPTPTTTPTPTVTPTPTETPTPAPITVQLVVDPPAALRVDGRPYGTGRVTGGPIELLPGTHTFTLVLPDFPERTMTLDVTADTTVLSLTLDVGMLTVMVDQTRSPPGGVAYLDGRELGPVPLVRRKVPAGEHVLTVRWPGVDATFEKVIQIPRLPNELHLPPVAPPAQ